MSVTLALRGAGGWWIRRYLTLLGATETAPGIMAGPGWTARLTEGQHEAFGTVWPQVTVEFRGDDPVAVTEAARLLKQMANRGGG